VKLTAVFCTRCKSRISIDKPEFDLRMCCEKTLRELLLNLLDGNRGRKPEEEK